MEEFKILIHIIKRLLAPDGCPWDREQTLSSMRSSLLEEVSEVIEAIDLNDNQKIEEELGDLFFNVLFLSELAEKDGRFTKEDVWRHISAKLVRRHPHIFGNAKVKDSEEVLKQWEKIKNEEKGKKAQQSALDAIPKNLPSLARAQKMFNKMKKAGYPDFHSSLMSITYPLQDEESLGATLFSLVAKSSGEKLDAEQALRKFLAILERKYRNWEQQNS